MANDTTTPASLGSPPDYYDKRYFARTLRTIELKLEQLTSVGPIRVSTVNISDLPTSSTGLKTGDLWNDTGTVKIV